MAKDPKDANETQTDSDVTVTLTDIGYKNSDADINKALRKLLGSQKLKTKNEKQVLLMLHDPMSRKEYLSSESIEIPSSYVGGAMILGPYPLEDLYNKVKAGLLLKEDRLQYNGDRWKLIVESYPEWAVFLRSGNELGGRSEFTQSQSTTEELTRTDLDMDEVSMGESGLELEDVPGEYSSAKRDRRGESLAASAKSEELSKVNEPGTETKSNVKRREQVKYRPQQNKESSTLSWLLMLTILIGAGSYWWVKKSSELLVEEKPPEYSGYVAEAQVRNRQEWPEKVRPLSPESMFVDDGPLLKKIRPILRAYESGVNALSRQDEYLLRRLASPASASWKVRKIAANQLAVYLLSRSKPEEAREILQPILQAETLDFITLVNNAIIDLTELNLSQARDSLRVSLRIDQSMKWISLSLLGYLEGLDGHWEESNRYFKDALNQNQNNPFISGLWLKVLIRQNKGSSFQIQKLVEDALWADPDTLIDSPIPAPLAGGVIQSEALEGIVKGAEQLGKKLSKGRLLFARWLQGRVISFSALTSPLSEVSQELALEESLQSQALYAYTLQRQGEVEKASEVLSKILPLVEKGEINSSWLWTFAGDIQAKRTQIDQAILYYQAALNKNSYDYAAVHGLGLMLRERSQFDVAVQKMQESKNIGPHFIPAQLRISRFEWQALLGVQ